MNDSSGFSDPAESPRAHWRRRGARLVAAVGVLAVFVAGAALIVKSKPEQPKVEQREPVFAVRAVVAEPGARRPAVLLVGEVEARDYAALNAPVEAEVLEIPVREGESFSKDSRLLILDLREQQLDVRSRRAAMDGIRLQLETLSRNREADRTRLAETKNLLDIAERDLQRNLDLQEDGVVSQRSIETSEQTAGQRRLEYVALQNQVDNYDIDRESLERQLESARAGLAQAALLVERGELRAPFAGKVAKVHASAGARPARGTPLIEIFNPRGIRLRALTPNRYAADLAGGDVRARLQTGGKTWDLSVSNVSPRAAEGQGGVEAFFDLPEGAWVLGATYEFELQLPPVDGAMTVPFDAVYAGGRIYFVDDEDRARGVNCDRIGISRESGSEHAVLRCPGIKAGDRIIATQLPGLAEGAKIQVL